MPHLFSHAKTKLVKAIFYLLPALAALAGCRPNIAQREARERGLPLVRQALEAEQRGELDKAVKLYQDSLMANPGAASAHLGLAILLQEHRQDFLNAAHHYQRYLELQPGSQKEEIVRHRKTVAEQFLTQQLVRSHGDAAGVIQRQLLQNIETFKQKIASLEAEKTRLELENAGNQATIKTQAAEIERQKRLLDRMVAPAPAPVKPPPRRVEIPDISNEKPPPKPPVIPALPPRAEAAPAPRAETPAKPRTHTVQPDETLYRIADRYYDDPLKWTLIRDANQDILGADGRLRVGQVLVIPR